MKSFKAFLLVVGILVSNLGVALVASQEESACADEDLMDPPDCPPDGDGEATYFPYPYDCTKYFECSNGGAVCLQCPNGTVWDQELNVCNHELVVPCVIITTLQPRTTTTTTTTTTTQAPNTTTTPPPTTEPTTTTTPPPTTESTTTTTPPPTTEPTTTTTPPPTTEPTTTTTPPPTTESMTTPTTPPPTTTTLPPPRSIIDIDDHIPVNGFWNFNCLEYSPHPILLSCVDFPMSDYNQGTGFWVHCPPSSTPPCDISYQVQPEDVTLQVDYYATGATTSSGLIYFYDGLEWNNVTSSDGWSSFSMDLTRVSGSTVIVRPVTNNSSQFAMLDKILLY